MSSLDQDVTEAGVSAGSSQVMISSIMRGREDDRAALARVIEELGDVAWYADEPPHEFRNIPAETLSFKMAEDCDLYLLVIFPRYGSVVFPDDPRSVTHQEFDHARGVNPYKIEVFIAAEALESPDGALLSFITTVRNFRDGYAPHTFHSLTELLEQARTALAVWRDGGATGRNAYVSAVANEYRDFRNPVTGKVTDYGAAVQLQLRVKSRGDAARPKWGEGDGEEDYERRSRAGERSAGRRQERERQRDRQREQERERMRAASPPKVLRDLLAGHQRLVVIGDVGSGKSTLLKRMAHDAASAYFRALGAPLPMLVTATRLGRGGIEYADQPLAVVMGLLLQDDARYDAQRQSVNRTVSEAIYRGEALLLIDGLDEASAAEQATVFRLLGEIETNQAALASRPSAYSSQLAGWQIADLQQLGDDQRRLLVIQTFRAEMSEQDEASNGNLPTLADKLLQELRDRPSDLGAWAGNPLLLTLIAVQYLRDQRLPENRARIYEFALEDLQRQRPLSAQRSLSEREVSTYLRLLALRMTEALRRDTTIAEAWDVYLRDSGISAKGVVELLERSGALQRDATATAQDKMTPDSGDVGSRYEFVHISFREYLAACALADKPQEQRHEMARRHRLHQAWEQPFILLANQLDLLDRKQEADALIRLLIEADRQRVASLKAPDPTHVALGIATRCALSRGRNLDDWLYSELKSAWRPIWLGEERRLRTTREFVEFWGVGDTNLRFSIWGDRYLEIALTAQIEAIPGTLGEGTPPLLSDGLIRHRPFPLSTEWLAGPFVALLLLGIVLLDTAITFSIGPLSSSDWGHWTSQRLPVIVLCALVSLVLTRVWSSIAARSRVRREMVAEALDVRTSQQALGQLGERAPVDPLFALLQDSDWPVRMSIARRMFRLYGLVGNDITDLTFSFPSPSAWAAARALGGLGERVPLEPLLALTQDSKPFVRQAAAEALGGLGERVPLELPRALLLDSQPGVRRAAAVTLSSRTLTPELVRALYSATIHPRGWRSEAVMRVVHWLTDWPALAGVMLLQLALIVPAVTAWVAVVPGVHLLLGLTAWWQGLIFAALYVASYLLTAIVRARVVYGDGRQEERAAMFEALESVLRRQVADATSAALVTDPAAG